MALIENAVYEKTYWESLFVSFEPLLEELDNEMLKHLLEDEEVNWIIVGAETGNGKRYFNEQWGLEILELAKEYDIPFFFKKQYKNGEWTNKLNGKEYLEKENLR